ncbi:MAG TPA: hypothetical protein VFQ80_11980 [Thermomicrobiales bacterium]|jgi:hypothetical protein|nr:hypothetical protein [Thermomicrobiales bacterium]
MRRWVVVLAVAALAAAAIWWFGVPAAFGPSVYPAASPAILPAGLDAGTPVVAAPADIAWSAAFQPTVRAADDTARRLVAMGAQRSRNLLAIRAAQREMIGRLAAADGFLRLHPAPPSGAATAAELAYRDGAVRIRAAMDDALAGFIRFDWQRVRRATAEMTAGETSLAAALATLDRLAAATPATA